MKKKTDSIAIMIGKNGQFFLVPVLPIQVLLLLILSTEILYTTNNFIEVARCFCNACLIIVGFVCCREFMLNYTILIN